MLKLFNLSDVQEYREVFYNLMPEYQLDGCLSRKKAQEYFQKGLSDGIIRFEWMHQKLDGESIPCEVTLVRTKLRNDFILISYTRDLREHKKMTVALDRHTRLLDTVNTAAAILLANNDIECFESSLLKCFDLVGHCLNVDRVQIWRNEIIEDEPHFALRYEWLSEYGKTCISIPIGLKFPYSTKKTWAQKFLQYEFINSPVSKLQKEDQEFLGYYKIKSIVMIPLFLEGDFWGFFSIDDCRIERTFSDEEIKILASAGLMMSSAINRNSQILKTREAEERTQIMIDEAPLCAIFWDKNLKLVDCNQEAVRVFGLTSKKEFIDNFGNLSPEYQPDGLLSTEKGGRLVKKAMDEGYSRFEWMHQKLNGEPIPADVICIRVKHKDEFTVTEYVRDLREQKAMIAQMRKAEIAEESSKAKSDFLARMSHEIRTPMNAILGISEIQLQDQSHPYQTKEAFERIYNSGDMLLGIINDILDLSKIEAGKLILLPAQYDITSLIHDTVQLNLMRYESKPIEFILDVKEDLPLILIGDELRIKQILNNLISNAFKYTNEGMVNLTIYAEPASTDDITKKTLVFVVSDTGQGMTVDQIKKLGTEYSRFNLEANRQTEGTGLGLNITRNLVQLMNGTISLESTPGLGSTFTIRLPQNSIGSSVLGRELADNLMKLNPDNSQKIKTFQIKKDFMPYGRVLVVDDVETNLYVARGLLAAYGLSVETVMSGFEAVDKIRDGFSYDIIFMDHMMPRMDGIEAAKIIRSLGYSKPIIALTANALAGHAEMFLKNGFDDFISKPIDVRQLNLALNFFIRDKYPSEIVEAAKKQKDRLYSGSVIKKQVDSQLAEFFVKDAKKVISILEAVILNKCRKADDFSVFIVNIHAMKSALGNIGEMELSAEAGKLEKAGREQNSKLILSELPKFMEMLNNVIDKLNTAEETQVEEGVYDKQYLKEHFLDIKEACIIYDKKAAKKAMDALKDKLWPQSIKKYISTIASHLLHSDFEEAIKTIDDFMESFSLNIL
jgi:signal transduction histidine kinase/DNA-binding response OmpR family regulator